MSKKAKCTCIRVPGDPRGHELDCAISVHRLLSSRSNTPGALAGAARGFGQRAESSKRSKKIAEKSRGTRKPNDSTSVRLVLKLLELADLKKKRKALRNDRGLAGVLEAFTDENSIHGKIGKRTADRALEKLRLAKRLPSP